MRYFTAFKTKCARQTFGRHLMLLSWVFLLKQLLKKIWSGRSYQVPYHCGMPQHGGEHRPEATCAGPGEAHGHCCPNTGWDGCLWAEEAFWQQKRPSQDIIRERCRKPMVRQGFKCLQQSCELMVDHLA